VAGQSFLISGGWLAERPLVVEVLQEGEYVGEGEEEPVISDPASVIISHLKN